MSANGAKIGFTVKIDGHSDKRLYVANADGTEFTDVTGNSPREAAPGCYQPADERHRHPALFPRLPHRVHLLPGHRSSNNSYVALLGAAWVDARKPYTLDAAGNTLFLKHQVEATPGVWRVGLYSCPVGGTPAIVFNIDQIPPLIGI